MLQIFVIRRYTRVSTSKFLSDFTSPEICIRRPPKLIKTSLQFGHSGSHLHVFVVIFQLVLEHLAVHHILVLVDKGAHAGGASFVLEADNVEIVRSVRVDRTRQNQFVVRVFLDLVNVRVDVQLDRQLVHTGARRDARNCIQLGAQQVYLSRRPFRRG